jgi:5-carboxyvanillate decarboxylase
MRIIAVEEHFQTEEYTKYLHSRKEPPRREWVEKDGKKYEKEWWSLSGFRLMDPAKPSIITDLGKIRLEHMDAAGVDMQVLSLSFPGVEMFEAANAATVARSVNDELYEAIKKYPQRFAGYATLPSQVPEAAAGELERAVTKLGFKAAMINGHIRGEYLDDVKYRVILATAEKLKVPLYIHPKMPPPDMLKYFAAYPGLASAMLGFPADASLHAMRLILSGVFDIHPGLKIILGHLGEALPFWLWRMDSRWEEERTVDPSSAQYYKNFRKKPSEYFKENFYVTNSGMYWEPALKFVIQVLGANRIMFATDFPYENSREAIKFIKSAAIGKGDREKICETNAKEILKL